jgi:hypothetical protein
MNKLIKLLVLMSVFSVAQESTPTATLEGTLSSKELTLYTELLSSWFGTDMKVISDVNSSSVFTLPLSSLFMTSLEKREIKRLKGNKVSINLPKAKLTVEVDSSCTTEHGKNIYNAEAGVRYTFESGVGLETGYKVIHLKSDEIEDLKIKSDSLGLYGRLVMAF